MTVITKDLSFEGGSLVPPWDDLQLAGTHSPNSSGTDALQYGVANGSRFPGFSKYAYMKVIAPAYASTSNSGWHVRCFPAFYTKNLAGGNYPSLIGNELWIRGAFYCPSAENTNGKYNGGQVVEFLHPHDWPQLNDPSQNIVQAQIAHFMLFHGVASETWDGQAFHPYSGSTNCLCFRIATGYVPGLPTGGPRDQTYWHSNILVFDPFPMDIPVWFILHLILHEDAGGSPPGGLNKTPYSLPVLSGSDTAPGTLELWCIQKATQPVAADFGTPKLVFKPENNTGIPTLLYRSSNGDGTGSAVHDAPYGPAGPGEYDSGATTTSPTNLNSSVSFAGFALDSSFDAAVAALTGGGTPPPPPSGGSAPTIPALSSGKIRYGITSGGSSYSAGGMSADTKRGSKITVTQETNIDTLWIAVLGVGTSGTQSLRVAVYDSSAPNGDPGALLFQSATVDVSATAQPTWQSFAVSPALDLPAGDYWLMIQSGPTTNLAGYFYDAVTGALRLNNDVFSDGASNPAGTMNSDDIRILACIEGIVVSVSKPTPTGATISGRTLTLTFSSPLDTSSIPDPSVFGVSGVSTKQAISDPLIFPIRAAVYYGNYPSWWTSSGLGTVFYNPTLGKYTSTDQATIDAHLRALDYAGIQVLLYSWWGQNQVNESTIVPLILSRILALGLSIKFGIYYELEGSGNPTSTQIGSDLLYLTNNYTQSAAFAKINGKPIIFVYNADDDAAGQAMLDRWAAASGVTNWYRSHKVFPGYSTLNNQPDSWHQYGPNAREDDQPGFSFNISPGEWKASDTSPILTRDPTLWAQNIKDQAASVRPWQTLTTFNEWPEGTAIESAQEWASLSGYGVYADALNQIRGNTRVTAITVIGTQVTLTLAAPVSVSDQVKLSYTPPNSNSLKGTAGDIVDGFVAMAVTNQAAFPTFAVIDNFNRTDGDPGANWELVDGPGKAQISGNKLIQGQASFIRMVMSTVYNADQESYFTVSGNYTYDLLLRYNTTDNTGYVLEYDSSTHTITIYKRNGATFTTIGSQQLAQPLSSGDRLGFKAAGTQLSAFVNSNSVLQVVDSTYNRSGKIGLGL